MTSPLSPSPAWLALPLLTACGRFAPQQEPQPGDSGDSAPVAPCTEVSVGPFVSAVGPDAATVMVRVDAPCRLVAEASATADFSTETVRSAAVHATPARDLTAHLRLEGLAPGQRYSYRILQDGEPLALPSPRSFRTAPSPAEPGTFTIGFVSDALTEDIDPALAYERLGLLEPQLVIQLGDLDHRDPGTVAPWTVDTWRVMHREQLASHRAGVTLDRAILADTPFFHTWDDHDYGNNDADGLAPWRDLALQAFEEYYPLPPDAPAPEQGVWYAFRWGQAEIFMLDLRSQRSPGDAEDGPDKSMLDHFGLAEGQRDWLLARLEASDATWKVIVSSSCWNPYGKQSDAWSVYRHEQDVLLAFLAERGIQGLLVVSGDMHSGGGIDDGSYAGLPEMTVPATNINLGNCTGGSCGSWSEGIQVGNQPAGFATLTLSYEPKTGAHEALLRTWSEAGAPRLTFALDPAQAVVRQVPVTIDW